MRSMTVTLKISDCCGARARANDSDAMLLNKFVKVLQGYKVEYVKSSMLSNLCIKQSNSASYILNSSVGPGFI